MNFDVERKKEHSHVGVGSSVCVVVVVDQYINAMQIFIECSINFRNERTTLIINPTISIEFEEMIRWQNAWHKLHFNAIDKKGGKHFARA